jgi:dCTP deaminase
VSFWSGEKLLARLPTLFGSDFDKDCVKSARYTLHVGAEVFITASKSLGVARKGLTTPLAPNGPFKIPAGQFAFILTEERVRVPDDALALISVKTSLKFRGLVNVSGFHVDPGWDGHLQFGIFNAGPNDVHLRRGQEMFLIWYADLDQLSKKTYKNRPDKGVPRISSEDATNLAGQIYSPQVLAAQIRKLRTQVTILLTVGALLLSAVAKIMFTPEPKAFTVPMLASPTSQAATQVASGAPQDGQPAEPSGQTTSNSSSGPQTPKSNEATNSKSPSPSPKNAADAKGLAPKTN